MGNQLMSRTKTMTIASGATTSNAIEVEDYPIYGLLIPAITSGTVKLQGTMDEGSNPTFYDFFNEIADPVLTFPAGPGSSMISARAMEHIRGCHKIRVVAQNTQASSVDFTLYMRQFPS